MSTSKVSTAKFLVLIFFELKNQREERDTQIIQVNKNILDDMTVINKNMSELVQQHAKSVEQIQVTNSSLTAILQHLIERKIE